MINKKTKGIGIYVHVPFCVSKCTYCSFCSGVYDKQTQKKYFDKLFLEIKNSSSVHKVSSVFFGGGTPSVASPEFLIETLNVLRQTFVFLPNAEITLEANPGTVSEKSLQKYLDAGFNRISFGGQSFSDDTLLKLGRRHNAKDLFDAVMLAQQVGFKNINVDLILGADQLEHKEFLSGVKTLQKWGCKHLSVYMLMLENGTKLYERVQSGQTTVSLEEDVATDYKFVQKSLAQLGFLQYEISNFAYSGFECKHNQNYWQVGEYLAFGVSAHSYIDGIRAEHTSVLKDYIDLPLDKLIVKKELLTQQDKIEEYIMLGLRTNTGINFEYLKSIGFDILTEKKTEISTLLKNNMVQLDEDFLKINPQFYVVSSAIILMLV